MAKFKRSLLALLWWPCCVIAQAQPQFGADHVVLYPAVITPSTQIRVSVPVESCYISGQPADVISGSSVQVTANVVSLKVSILSFLCFSAGDPVVKKAVWFSLPNLPEGVYTLAYELLAMNGVVEYQESVQFAVVSAPPESYTGLWWKSPAGSESGWGLSVEHQGDTLFCVWYTYGADGTGVWLVMPDGRKTGDRTYAGSLYRTTSGPRFDSTPWNSSSVTVATVGSATLTFSDANNGTFSYTYGGVTQSKSIGRQVFWGPTQ
jgi:hypothetical protein